MNEDKYIIANWKMNPITLDSALTLVDKIKDGVLDIESVKVILCPPFPFIAQILPSNHIELGAQNCFWEDQGPYTGEISAPMLKALGCSYVIVGHSERKNHLKEDNEQISKKVEAVCRAGLTPILCIGEKQRTTDDNFLDLSVQLEEGLRNVNKGQMLNVILVYEPEWAISSNKNAQAATPEDCKRSIDFMREIIQKRFGKDVADLTTILYGGSTNSGNIKDYMNAGAAGALVGSASLDSEEFIELVRNAVV
jgi:triosephosphate isomerase